LKFSFAILFVLAATLLLAGCASNAGAGGNAAAGAPAQENSAPAAASGENSPPSPPVDDSGLGETKNALTNKEESASDKLAKFFGLKDAKSWKAEYILSTVMPGTGASTSTMAIFFGGKNTMRTDAEYSGMKTRIYILYPDSYYCNYFGIKWTCMSLPKANESVSDQAENDFESDPSKYSIEPLPPKLVAGILAECFKMSKVPFTGSDPVVSYCSSPEGIPLYTKTEFTDSGKRYETVMEATSYSTIVPASDFELPAKPSAAPTVGGDTCAYCDFVSGSDRVDCLANC